MKSYTLDQLRNAATYANDGELATFTRKICATTHTDEINMPFGDWKREYLAGLHAEHVYAELTAKIAADAAAEEARRQAQFAANNKILAALEKLTLPTGIELAGYNDTQMFLKAPRDGGDLAKRLGRVGGEWSRENKYFILPLSAATGLQRILNNWRKAQDERDAAEKIQQQQRAAAKAKADAERQVQRAAARERERKEREQQQRAQAKAVAERVQVVVGEHRIGDMLNGKPITGFGKRWSESSLSRGTLYQECDFGRCEGEPVCVQCFKCAKHCGCCEQITYCYAYFD